jgi:hypothetical protein
MELSLHSHQFTEDNVKKAKISPMTSLLMSLSLVVGIFVAGLTNSRVLPAAKAQNIQQVTFGAPNATLSGPVIAAKGVVINGVASDALIPGSVRISDSVVDSGCGITALGFNGTGDAVYILGVFTSGNDGGIDGSTGPNGVFTSGNFAGEEPPIGPSGVFTSGNVYVGSSLQIVGGILSGTDIQVIDGVISGSNLQVTGGYVTGACGH